MQKEFLVSFGKDWNNNNNRYKEERDCLNANLLQLPDNIIGGVIGAPYVGKGRTLRHLRELYGVQAFEVSDALRESTIHSHALPFMKAGELVPLGLTLQACREKVASMKHDAPTLMVGFPRCRLQAEDVVRLGLQIFQINTPISVCSERARKRLEELRLNPEAIDIDRGDRNDETEPAIIKRFGIFILHTLPALHHLEENGLLRQVDGEAVERAHSIAATLKLSPLRAEANQAVSV
jgi:adenylate kinase family enzyme